MSRTKRQKPRNGEFKRLKASSKKQRNKKQRAKRVNLTRCLMFVSKHREQLDITGGRHASMYMEGNEDE